MTGNVGHHPHFFWQEVSSTEKLLAVPKDSQRKGFAEKNTTEGSLENRKLNTERDAFRIPQQNTTETLFTLEDLPKAKVSRREATAHTHPWKAA